MFKRAATELLSLKKDDVQSILRATVNGKNEDIVQALGVFSCFNGWSEESIKKCSILAYIKRYLPDTIIADCSNTSHGYTYFVLDGVCSVIQKVVLRTRTGFRGRKLFAIHNDQNAVSTATTLDTEQELNIIFVTIRTFTKGDCFGLGEDLTNRWILSKTAARCLVIPRDFLLQHNHNNIWPRLRQKINASFPSQLEIYNSLIQQVKWCKFKTEYVQHLRRRKQVNSTTIEDVPYHWRICVSLPKFLF